MQGHAKRPGLSCDWHTPPEATGGPRTRRAWGPCKEMGRGLPWAPGGVWAVGSGQGGGHHQRQDEAAAALAILRAEITAWRAKGFASFDDFGKEVLGCDVPRLYQLAKSAEVQLSLPDYTNGIKTPNV